MLKFPSSGAPILHTPVNKSLRGGQIGIPSSLPKTLTTNIHIWDANYCQYNNLHVQRTCHFFWMKLVTQTFPFGHLFFHSGYSYRSYVSSYLTFCFVATKHYNPLL